MLANHSAVLLSSGIVSGYLFLEDERVWLDQTSCDDFMTLVPASEADTALFIYVGATLLKIPELLDLLPSAPESSVTCPKCDGQKMRFSKPANQDTWCYHCSCRGWVVPSENQEEPAKESS